MLADLLTAPSDAGWGLDGADTSANRSLSGLRSGPTRNMIKGLLKRADVGKLVALHDGRARKLLY